MPHSQQARDWLAFAHDDLAAARCDLAARICCFHAQQAAEKAIKAVLVAHLIDFPWTHSLPTLTKLLPDHIDHLPAEQAHPLSAYASERYPRVGRAIRADAVSDAVELARAAVAWAERNIEPSAATP